MAHTCVSVAFTSWFVTDCGVWTLWQVVQVRFRASCVLPSQPGMRAAVVAGQARLVDVGRLQLVNFMMCPFASSSTCACPGPWQLSHPSVAGG